VSDIFKCPIEGRWWHPTSFMFGGNHNMVIAYTEGWALLENKQGAERRVTFKWSDERTERQELLLWVSDNFRWQISISTRGMFSIIGEMHAERPCIYYYSDWQIGYDYPERIPKYVKKKFRSIIHSLRKQHKTLMKIERT